MKIVFIVLAVLLLFLQYQLWLTHQGLVSAFHLKHEITNLQKTNHLLAKRNQKLIAQIQTVKQTKGMVEDLAREEIGMVKQGEKYYQFSATPKA